MKEEAFWKNYFYRVSLINQSAQLTALAAQQAAECSEEKGAAGGPQVHHPQGAAALSITVSQNAVFCGKRTWNSTYTAPSVELPSAELHLVVLQLWRANAMRYSCQILIYRLLCIIRD